MEFQPEKRISGMFRQGIFPGSKVKANSINITRSVLQADNMETDY